MGPRRTASLLAALLILFALAPSASAHGAWTEPRCRGTLSTHSLTLPDLGLKGIPTDDCPHCLNGGGKGGVMAASNKNWRPWEPLDKSKPFRHDAGLCGDPVADPAPRAHEKGGAFGPPKAMPYSAKYRPGQTVGFQVDITTNHNGFFEFFICNVDKCGGDITAKCFTDGHCRQLMRAKTPECESMESKECGPVDPDYPGRWIVPCRVGGHVGEHFMGGKGTTMGKFMQYKLPEGFSCENCVMQWYWASANSCNPPGFVEYFEKFPMKSWGKCPGDGGAFGARNPTLATCGGPTFPEEFWSCADVQVTGAGAGGDDGHDDLGTRKGGDVPAAEPKPIEEPRPAAEEKPVEPPRPAEEARPAEEPKPVVEQEPVVEERHQEPHQPDSHKPTAHHSLPEQQNTPEEHNGQAGDGHQDGTRPGSHNSATGHADPEHRAAAEENNRHAAEQHQEQHQDRPHPADHPPHEDVHRPHGGQHQPQRSHHRRQRHHQRRQEDEQRRQRDQHRRQQDDRRRNHHRHQPVSGAATASDCVQHLEFRKGGEEEADPVNARCASKWKQCGGKFYTGPTNCCSERFECVVVNEYFAQCKAPARRR